MNIVAEACVGCERDVRGMRCGYLRYKYCRHVICAKCFYDPEKDIFGHITLKCGRCTEKEVDNVDPTLECPIYFVHYAASNTTELTLANTLTP